MSTVEQIQTPNMISRMALTQRAGWTKASIEKFLGPPDVVQAANRGENSPMVHLFAEERIQIVERSETWKTWVAGADERKRRALHRHFIASRARIYVRNEGKSVAILLHEAIRTVRADRIRRGLSVGGFTVSELPASDVERILTNYIRHRYTNYDSLNRKLDPQPDDTPKNYILLRRRVMVAMGEEFPDLRGVFERQLAARERWDIERSGQLAA